jgi:hypothetical protein
MSPNQIFRAVAEVRTRMSRHLVGLLILSLGLLAGACSDQSALGPSSDQRNRPAFKPAATSPDSGATGTGKGGPGGSAGGFKK